MDKRGRNITFAVIHDVVNYMVECISTENYSYDINSSDPLLKCINKDITVFIKKFTALGKHIILRGYTDKNKNQDPSEEILLIEDVKTLLISVPSFIFEDKNINLDHIRYVINYVYESIFNFIGIREFGILSKGIDQIFSMFTMVKYYENVDIKVYHKAICNIFTNIPEEKFEEICRSTIEDLYVYNGIYRIIGVV